MTSLPHSLFKKKWIKIRDWRAGWVDAIFAEHERCVSAPGWNPKLVRLEGDTFMVDTCGGGWDVTPNNTFQFPTSIAVIEYVDHPFLSELPTNAPRAVKAIYRKEVRLKHLRATEFWGIANDMDNAKTAWEKFKSETT